MTKNNKIVLIASIAILIAITITAYVAVKNSKKEIAAQESGCKISLQTKNEQCVKDLRNAIISSLASSTIAVPLPSEEGKYMQAQLNNQYMQNLIGEWNIEDYRGSVAVMTDKLELFSKNIALVPIAVNEGGSGEFVSLAAFNIENNKLVGVVAATPLGDRIDFDKVESLGEGSKYPEIGTISVRYLAHGEEQAMAETPNQPQTLIVKLLVGEEGKLKFSEPIR